MYFLKKINKYINCIMLMMMAAGCASANHTDERFPVKNDGQYPDGQGNQAKPFAYGQTNGWKVDNTSRADNSDDRFCAIPVYCENDMTFDEQFSPYYALLTDDEKYIYRQLYDAVTHLSKKVHFKDKFQTADYSFYKIDLALGYDHPELFWYEKLDRVQHYVRYQGEDEKHLDSVSYELNYNDLADDLFGNQERLYNEVQKIVSLTRQFPTIREKELFVHDYLLGHVEYISGSDYNQTAYSALINRQTVCSGYARAFQIIMRQLRMPAYFVSGYKSDSNSRRNEFSESDLHSWNLVWIDGAYYNVDVTNDYINDLKPADCKIVNYKYFNRSDKFFSDNGYHRKSIYDYSMIYNTNLHGVVQLVLPAKAASNDNVSGLITSEHILKSLVAYYPDLPGNVVTTQDEFDKASLNQLKTGNSVYTLITNPKTYDKVSRYDWKQRNKRFIDEIESLRNVRAKSVTSTDYFFTDNICLFANEYEFK